MNAMYTILYVHVLVHAQPPAVITVVLRVRMHCEACAQVLQKRVGKIKGKSETIH